MAPRVRQQTDGVGPRGGTPKASNEGTGTIIAAHLDIVKTNWGEPIARAGHGLGQFDGGDVGNASHIVRALPSWAAVEGVVTAASDISSEPRTALEVLKLVDRFLVRPAHAVPATNHTSQLHAVPTALSYWASGMTASATLDCQTSLCGLDVCLPSAARKFNGTCF
ncbi:MAG: hypothetical protein M1833_006413 [Piccolia ochrophora]|nr:MAG: hypothetical protein M1833_006413 [Piccolia ochrophora]